MKSLRQLVLASFIQWLPLAAVTVLLSGVIAITMQQNYRNGANDPQLQMATDAQIALNNGATPSTLVSAQQIDIAQSLAPYLAIYDSSDQLQAASATLHGQPLAIPQDVFNSAKAKSPDILTWMPESGVRSAIVVMPYQNGYVVAGRSLKAVEDREDMLNQQIIVGCLGTLIGGFIVTLGARWLGSKVAPNQ